MTQGQTTFADRGWRRELFHSRSRPITPATTAPLEKVKQKVQDAMMDERRAKAGETLAKRSPIRLRVAPILRQWLRRRGFD
ncbi:MAG: hypothetical protein R3E60_04935 [Alphaproteobacteria bacterium]